VTGIKSFQRKMRKMPVAARKALTPATEKGADEIARMAETLALEDSGDLVGSIAVTVGPKNTPAHSHPGGTRTVPEGAAAVTAGNNDVRYAHLVEFGTRTRSADRASEAADRMRETGLEERQIADLLGQKTPSMARHYSRSANLADRNRITMETLEKENERRSQVVKPFKKTVKP